MKNKIWLSLPHITTEQLYMQKLFDTVKIAEKGGDLAVFESCLEHYFNQNKKVIALNSGTSALHLALILAGVKKNDVVICQSFTFVASANPILYQGAIPVFVDSEPITWNICPIQLEKAIVTEIKNGTKPKVIVATHTYGMPYKIDEINEIAKKYNIPIIEDAASALGSTFKDEKCGAFGEYGIISFNENKIITTFGGGALIASDDCTKKKGLFYATQAKDLAQHYEHTEIGYNYRMSAVLAGLGESQFKVLALRIQQRRAMHDFYSAIFENISDVIVFKEPSKDYFSNHWLSAILLKNEKQREALRLHLEKKHIESRPLWKPMHLQPVFEKYVYYGKSVSEDLFNRGLCLPSGSNLTNEDRARIKDAIVTFFNN